MLLFTVQIIPWSEDDFIYLELEGKVEKHGLIATYHHEGLNLFSVIFEVVST